MNLLKKHHIKIGDVKLTERQINWPNCCHKTHQPIQFDGPDCPLCEANGHISELMTENRELKEQVLTLKRSE